MLAKLANKTAAAKVFHAACTSDLFGFIQNTQCNVLFGYFYTGSIIFTVYVTEKFNASISAEDGKFVLLTSYFAAS